MVIRMKILLACLALAAVVSSCVTSVDPTTEAQRLTTEDLTQTPGFAWFPIETAQYNPDPVQVDRVRTAMAATLEKKIYMFIRPTCSCRGTQRMFPQIVKTLTVAGIPAERIEMWSMRSTTDSQPYSSLFTVGQLPAFYVVTNGVVTASLGDDFTTNYNEKNADSLIANAVSQ
jgi:hypothetical protein